MKYWPFIIVLSLSRLFSQVVLEGIVKESGSGQRVQYASVAVLDADADTVCTGGITTENGKFHISNVFPGKYFLEIDFIGYRHIRGKTFTVDKEEMAKKYMGEFILEPVVLEMDAVDISAAAPAVMSDVSKTVYNADQIYSATGGTCCDVMKGIPSVDVAANGLVSLRGSPEVAILLNGKRAGILGGERRTNIMSIPVPASMVDKVEVITSPSAKQDADGMVGVINIILKENQDSGFNGHVNVNLGNTEKSNAGAYFNFRKGRINHFWNISTEDLHQSGTGSRRSELVSLDGEISDKTLRTVNTATRNQTTYLSGGSRYSLSERTILNAEVKLVPFQRTKDESIDLGNQNFDINKQENGQLRLLDLGFLSESAKKYRLSGEMTLESQNKDVSQSGKESGAALGLSMEGKTDLERRILNLDYEYFITPSLKVETGVKK